MKKCCGCCNCKNENEFPFPYRRIESLDVGEKAYTVNWASSEYHCLPHISGTVNAKILRTKNGFIFLDGKRIGEEIEIKERFCFSEYNECRKNQSDYKILSTKFFKESSFEEIINNHLKNGYSLCGSLIISDGIFYQAVVKEV